MEKSTPRDVASICLNSVSATSLSFPFMWLGKGVRDLSCLGQESIVEIDHTYKFLQTLDGDGLWQVNYSLDFVDKGEAPWTLISWPRNSICV